MFSIIMRALLLALLPLVAVVASSSANGTGAPGIISPASGAQVDAGFSGPIAVDFADAPAADYYVQVYATAGSTYDDTETVTQRSAEPNTFPSRDQRRSGYAIEVYPSADAAPEHTASSQFSVVAPPPAATSPSAPEKAHAGHVRSHRTTLYWACPADDGQSPITGYRVVREGIEGVAAKPVLQHHAHRPSPHLLPATQRADLAVPGPRQERSGTWPLVELGEGPSRHPAPLRLLQRATETPPLPARLRGRQRLLRPSPMNPLGGSTHLEPLVSGTTPASHTVAAGHYRRFRVELRLDRVKTHDSRRYYSRLRYGRVHLNHSYPLRPTN